YGTRSHARNKQEIAERSENPSIPKIMNWYYVEGGKQTGPVDDAQLEEMARNGTIQGETLVWREGLANWQSYREVKPGQSGEGSPVAGEAVCAECGKLFEIGNMIQFNNAYVCAGCK